MNPEIIFEDHTMLVINKPAGMVVNRSDTTHGEVTVQDWAEERLGIQRTESNLSPEEDGEEIGEYKNAFWERGGVVHRLDKETSGVLLLAKTPETFLVLQKQFRERTVTKTYLALAHGRVTPETGEINIPVGRLPWNRRQFGIVAGGRESVTLYRVKSYYRTNDRRREVLTLLELEPKTGRTHQIRVHLKYLNHPIFADFLYAGRKTAREDRKLLWRVFLHAGKITFSHPITGEPLTSASPLPEELQAVLDQLIPEA